LIEDPLHEDDFEGVAQATKRLDTLIVGDDLFVTNVERLKRGISLGAAGGMIFKPNMVGTLSEAWDAAQHAKRHGYWLIPSGRAGGGADDPVADIAVAIGAELMKCGSPQTAERTGHQNRLLRIEEELGACARFFTIGG
jgi:enolase